MTNFLFEIYSYEIPYDLQIQAEIDIKNLLNGTLKQLNIQFTPLVSFSTNRRLIFYSSEIEENINPIVTKKKGPSVNASSDIIERFLVSNGITIEQCYTELTSKGKYYFFNTYSQKIQLKNKINDIITEVLNKVNFSRSMFWNETKVKWPRPIINFILMLGEQLIDFTFAGVKSSRAVKGHAFLCNEAVDLVHAKDYFKVVSNLKVVLLANEKSLHEINEYKFSLPELASLTSTRKQIIVDAVENFAKQHNIVPNLQENLLKELTYLTEYPVILFGKIPSKYLILPKELLVDTMVKNQRYINFFNNEDNSISEFFAIIANIETPDNGKEIIKGNQRVLNARLEDGLFFYNLDINENWLTYLNKLKNINFFEGLGSLYDKQERLKDLSLKLFQEEDLAKICGFCKVDLASKVVAEFPDLQGIMGYYYSQLANFSEEEAIAIKEQYMPLISNGELPRSILGAKLAIVDKLDTLISFFRIGQLPTSSSDPFALRRAALGIIRICIHHQLNLNLSNFVENNLLEFLSERLIIYLSSLNINKSITMAVLNKDNFNITDISNKAVALNEYLISSNDIISLFKRIFNILTGDNVSNISYVDINHELLITREEKDLFESLTQLRGKYKEVYNDSGVIDQNRYFTLSQYKNYIQDVNLLKPKIDLFVNNVHIVDYNNLNITSNRLSLLKATLDILQKIGKLDDISININ